MQHIRFLLVHTVVVSDNNPTMLSRLQAAHSKCTHEKRHNFLHFKKKKKKVVVVQKRYPKDISTTQGCELRDRVVLWNECLGELLTKTPLSPSLEK